MIMNNINWNTYRRQLDAYVNSNIHIIQKILEKNFSIKEDKKFYYKIFFLPLSKNYFNKKFISKKVSYSEKKYNISKFLDNFNYLKVNDLKKNNLKFNKNISLKFFHRHNEFREANSDIISDVDTKKLKKNFSIKFILINMRFKFSGDLKRNNILFLKRRLILLVLNYDFLIKNIKKVNNILISTHGIMSDIDQIILACLSKKAKIFSLQSGFGHFMFQYHDQDDYLKKISNKILLWGNKIGNNSQFISFGSFYSHINKPKNKKKIILLPQVPQRNFRMPISSYFSHNIAEFNSLILDKIMDEIKIITSKEKECFLQCKNVDFEYYKKNLRKYKIKNKLVLSNVNKQLYGDAYYKSYNLYLSTTIVENYFAGSKSKICVNSLWVDLKKKYEKQFNTVNNKFLKTDSVFIKNNCKKILPFEAKKKLIKVLNLKN